MLGRLFYGKWPHLASAYITGISVGILVRSPLLLALCAVQRDFHHVQVRAAGERPPYLEPVELRHCAMLFLAPDYGGEPQHSVGQLHLADARHLDPGRGHRLARAAFPHHRDLCRSRFSPSPSLRTLDHRPRPWQPKVAPITGPMYQLFIFFMITDPKTTVRSKRGQCLVVFLVALVEMVLRLDQVVYAPFYALFIVGPTALLIEMWLDSRRAGAAKPIVAQ